MGEQNLQAAWVAGAVALAACLLIVLTRRWHGRFTLDGTQGIQKFHEAPTPRIGGVGVVLGLVVARNFLDPGVARLLGLLLLAAIPAFFSGLLEDVTRRVSVRTRLLATMASGGLAWWIAGAALHRLDVPLLDTLLAWAPASLLFTAFAVGGVANAINIVDGFNGLAAGILLIALGALGVLAHGAGDWDMAALCAVVGASVLGFGLVNFPFGKIFLGDGGAYMLGYLLAAIAVLVSVRNPQLSPWAALLACAYPVLEVGFSVLRRARREHSPGHPDRLHLHSLINRRVVRKLLPTLSPTLRNSAVSPFVWVLAAAPAICGLLVRDSTVVLVLVLLVFALLYALAYHRLVRFAWFRRAQGPALSRVHTS